VTPPGPSTSAGSPEAILLAVCARCSVIGMDLVEVTPQYDEPGGPAGAESTH